MNWEESRTGNLEGGEAVDKKQGGERIKSAPEVWSTEPTKKGGLERTDGKCRTKVAPAAKKRGHVGKKKGSGKCLCGGSSRKAEPTAVWAGH